MSVQFRSVTPVAELRVYLPLDALPARERDRWARLTSMATDDSAARAAYQPVATLDAVRHPSGGYPDGAFWSYADGTVYVCPWRTRHRVLVAVLAARAQFPTAVADAIVPREQVVRAAAELEALRRAEPDAEVQILESAFCVPVSWFTPFEDTERMLVQPAGLPDEGPALASADPPLGIRYETSLVRAISRLERAVQILRESGLSESMGESVHELADWLGCFDISGRLELDYGGVASLFAPDAVADDHSAADLWATLGALADGDLDRAGHRWSVLAERWSAAQSKLSAN